MTSRKKWNLVSLITSILALIISIWCSIQVRANIREANRILEQKGWVTPMR